MSDSKSIVMRKNVTDEIISSEKSYVDHMSEVINSYLNPLKDLIGTSEETLMSNEIQTIFSNIESIHILHKEEVKTSLQYARHHDNFGETFVRLEKLFLTYRIYGRDLSRAQNVLTEAKKRPRVLKWLNDAREKSSSKLFLEEV